MHTQMHIKHACTCTCTFIVICACAFIVTQNWKFVDVAWLNKIKADSDGNVHLEAPS